MAKILNGEKVFTESKIKEIISQYYKIPKAMIELALWKTTYKNEYYFGYYVMKKGYSNPVCFQNEKQQLVLITPEEYEKKYIEKEYLVETEE